MHNTRFLTDHQKPALIWNDQDISYAAVLKKSVAYARMFDPKTTRKTAIFSANRPEWIYAFYSTIRNGCVAVPIDFMATVDEVAFQLNDCQAEVLFCSKEMVPVVDKVIPLLKYQIQTIIFEEIRESDDETDVSDIQITDMQKTAVIIYTSGTTGSPKGVMLSFQNMYANLKAVAHDIPIFTKDRSVMVLLPLHHIFPLVGTMVAPLFVGATMVFAPALTSEGIISTLQKGISIVIGVPRLYAMIRKGIMDKINANTVTKLLFKIVALMHSRAVSKKVFKKVHDKFGGRIEYLVSGGAKLDEAVARDYKILGFEMLEGFGMTEAAPMITFTRPGHWVIGSAGQALPGLEMKIQDEEILARGPNVMQGYYNRPDETAHVLQNGWLRTGDLGRIDEKGFLYVTGRLKEIIVLSNGKNINPVEIESKLLEISDCIAESAVFLKNDALHVLVVPNFKMTSEKGILNLDEYIKWEVIDTYNRMAAPYKKITQYTILKDEIPKTRLGKIQRFKLESICEAKSRQHSIPVEEPHFEEYHVIRDYFKNQIHNDVHPDDHIEIDLGLDSLDKVSLLSFLQATFGIDLKDDILIHHPTVRKLADFMHEKKQKMAVEVVRWGAILKERADLKLPQRWFTFNLLRQMSSILLHLYFRLKGEGSDNIPRGPCIIAPNHQSFMDGLLVAVSMKYQILRETYFFSKAKHVKSRWLKAFANRNNVIVMDINRDLKQSLQKLGEVLKNGKNIIIFPEGTRTHDGRLNSFKKTFAILSKELNVPVVPVSIKGAFEALPRGSRIPRPWKRINVKFHEPVYPANYDYDALVDQVYNKLTSEVG